MLPLGTCAQYTFCNNILAFDERLLRRMKHRHRVACINRHTLPSYDENCECETATRFGAEAARALANFKLPRVNASNYWLMQLSQFVRRGDLHPGMSPCVPGLLLGVVHELVSIPHRESFRQAVTGFRIVGLIASIRRVLVITLEPSQAQEPGKWTPEFQKLFNSSMIELCVLGGLILAMVLSIYLLRRSEQPTRTA
jgi:hypothetical protein